MTIAMLLVIFIIFGLAAINFLLLKFSSNKTTQRNKAEKPFIIRRRPNLTTTQQLSNQLVSTGS